MTTLWTTGPIGGEFARFAAIGTLGFLIDGALFQLFHAVLEWPIASARAVSAPCAIAATWALNRRLTFATRKSALWAPELTRYALLQGAGLAVNVATFTLALWLAPALRALPLAALAIGSAIAMFFNFVTSRTLAFRPDEHIG